MRKTKQSSLIICLAALMTVLTASADDLDVYQRPLAQAKVLFVLDLSGSMAGSRVASMKAALNTLINDISGLHVGLMSYSDIAGTLIYPMSDVDAHRTELLTTVNAMTTGGGTPTVSAMFEAQRYMTGGAPYRSTTPDGTPTYQPPPSSECESHHIVLLTDGFPNTDPGVVTDLNPMLGSCATLPSGTCGVELANYMATVDQFPGLDGNNNINLHTIGFDIDVQWLADMASAGEGLYRNASSSQDLVDVFLDILNNVDLAVTAAAPTVSVNAFNQSRHRNELFYSFFQPQSGPRWEGNVKKYKLVDGELVDANNAPVIEDGRVAETSASLWSVDSFGVPVADGEKVHFGGMAARQQAGKNWYTDAGLLFPANGQATPFLVTANNQVARWWFGAGTNNERNRLVNWLRGYDSIDRDDDGIQFEANRYVADSIHSSPVLVSYAIQESTGLQNEVLFTATNMGVLHAVNPLTGDELWSYSPVELLPNVKQYVDNTNEEHVYGFDGAIATDVIYKTSTSLDQEVEQARLFLTQRRGGSNMYGLDVTNALSSAPVERLWRIQGGVANTDFRDLAQTWSQPQIIPVRYGCPSDCEVKDLLMFGGGYNPMYDDETLTFPVTPSSTGHGNAIYLVDPDNGDLVWSAGNGNHHDLDLAMIDSVPDTPVATDTDGDGAVNVIFYSDIAGNIWRIDLDQQATDAQSLAVSGGKIAALNEPFQNLRFFNKPDVSISGTSMSTARFNISIGSGMRSSPLLRETDDNRFFVIKDYSIARPPTSVNPLTNTVEPDYRYVENIDGSRSIITPANLWNSSNTPTQYGFYKELEEGEKVLQPTLTTAGKVLLTSYMPPDPDVPVPACEAPPIGTSRLYVYDVLTGDNSLPSEFGDPYTVVGSGITDGGNIVDTGDDEGPVVAHATGTLNLEDLLAPTTLNNFRRFIRTGWNEIDD